MTWWRDQNQNTVTLSKKRLGFDIVYLLLQNNSKVRYRDRTPEVLSFMRFVLQPGSSFSEPVLCDRSAATRKAFLRHVFRLHVRSFRRGRHHTGARSDWGFDDA